ncbi:hypothetical protein GJ496_012048 [Pomphorhynchus laevis]|nr:hypothetical protein GJ496_012048 [Pomphorhynchus laevis]
MSTTSKITLAVSITLSCITFASVNNWRSTDEKRRTATAIKDLQDFYASREQQNQQSMDIKSEASQEKPNHF